MILVCKDFEFDDKTLSGQGLSSVNFDSDTSLPSSVVREMESGTMNLYRPEINGLGAKYTNTLVFDLHIVKEFDENSSQKEMEFLPDEYDSVVAWLSSPHLDQWMKITTENNQSTKVKGYFSSIEPYENWGICYGLRCTFTCNSPFSYVEKTETKQITGTTNFLLSNDSSEYEDYVYPIFLIAPTKTEDIYIHNLSDSEIVDNSSFAVSDDNSDNIQQLRSKINEYATSNLLTVQYVIDDKTKDVKLICNETGILFYLIDHYGVKNKYVAYFSASENQYWICRGGFFYCTVYQGNPIEMDCKNLSFYDSLERPVDLSSIGIQDEDEIYWARLIHGNNTIRVMGNITLNISYLEPKKGVMI